jgi:hypothetical protein
LGAPLRRSGLAWSLVLLAATALPAAGRALNGFNLEPSDIPADEIRRGGPPRDGIPALHDPETADASYVWDDRARVIGVELDGHARAYPLAILNWHELVNDELAGRSILVSYCPLCGSAIVFDRRSGSDSERSFGVSGLLYQSDLLMYDHETESLWAQMSARAVPGPARGERLELVRSRLLSWGEWKERHPSTTVLTRETGYPRDYARTPYVGYAESRRTLFASPLDPRFHPKMPTVGLRLPDGNARAYPLRVVEAAGGVVSERWREHRIRVAWDAKRGTFSVEAPSVVEVVESYWFAWAAFHPDTSVAGAQSH